MKKRVYLSAICALAINASALDIGTIQVESSTIDSKFDTKRTEVSTTTTISGEKVDEAHAESVQQLLQSIPGVTTEYSTGDSLKIHLRGVENQMYMGEKPGVAVVIDGVPVFERTGKVNIDLDNIESIKVVKGGASYLFGDDALSGAIIITTKKGAKYNNNFGAVEFGSYGFQKMLARSGYANDNLSFHIQASQRKADGYWEGSEYESNYLNGKLQYYLDDTSDISFGFEYSDRTKDSHGTVGGETAARTNPESVYDGDQESRDYSRDYNVELLKLFLTYSKDFSNNSNLLLNGYIYKDDTSFISGPQTRDGSGALNPSLNDKDYTMDNDYAQIQRGIKSEYRSSFDTFATLLGLDLRFNEYENKTSYRVNQALIKYYPSYSVTPDYYLAGDAKSDDTTDENVYAIYGEYKQEITKDLSVTANLRYDVIKLDYEDYKSSNFKEDFNIYSYRLGTNYKINESFDVYANYSTGFRAPTVTQLYAGSTSAWGSTANNPDLDPEKSYNYEIGVRAKAKGITYEAAIFQIDREDFIMKTSGNYGDTDTTDMWDNVGGARHRGLELSAIGNVVEELSFNIAYTYLDAYYTKYDNFGIDLDGNSRTSIVTFFDATNNQIPRTPKHQLNLILDYIPMKELKLTTEINAKSNYYADDLNEIKIPGHATLNLLASYTNKIGNYQYNLFARVDNLFDKFYYNTARASGDRNEDGVFNAEDLSITVNSGRILTAGLSVKF
ncbi:TonB-dependent receptor [Sulfurimonas sp.]|jgi:iron complex outermembrane receptor protein|uniref:TonB-dependent receptor n=1 Tax=Sulfurimonas sp. TaxID=2022749 RepID=UPI0025DE4E94|nr:TonB-dependent receptor [Sulfurimonas sp.]MCK9473463.1 TonB-dependent receptor [Sulfurimonas sp.]MDD3505472.1 TonB-dependent receptor [Sulfurimonas sp.]